MHPQYLDDAQRGHARQSMRHSILFSSLSKDQLERVLIHTRHVRLREREVLFEQHQPATDFYLLQAGRIKVAIVSRDGHEKIIDLLNPGATFAEAVLFSGDHSYPVTASALVDSEVWAIDSDTYKDILRQSIDACFAVLAQMSRRLHWQLTEIDRLSLHSAAFRLIAFLLDEVPSTDLQSSVVQFDTPKHVIASRLSMTPETFSRVLSKLSDGGYRHVNDNTVQIRDIEKLREYLRSGSPV